MGCIFQLNVGKFESVISAKSAIPPELLTVFSPQDKSFVPCGTDEEGEASSECYAANVSQLKEVLETLGFTGERARARFSEFISERNQYYAELRAEGDGGAGARMEFLQSFTFEKWMEKFQELFALGDKRYEIQYRGIPEDPVFEFMSCDWHEFTWYGYPANDPRWFLRALLEMCKDDDRVVLDYGDLVNGGYLDGDEDLCEWSHAALTADYSVNEKIIVLTEGSSDRNIIQASMQLLYPHLSRYYSFVDFDLANLPGGASSLVAQIKAFISSGIRSRVIALFDNDTAAKDCMRAIADLKPPPNFRILTYPENALAKAYPTIGPSDRVEELDVNGRAASLELYLGRESLTGSSGRLSPIQWKGFVAGVGQYQGEVAEKGEIQRRFGERLKACQKDSKLIASYDWVEMRSLLQHVFGAFK